MRQTAVLVLLASIAVSAQNTEIVNGARISRDRYDNCDYGYQVLLPRGVVAQGGPASIPSHGFVISPADPQTAKPFSLGEPRIIHVYDERDSQNLATPRAYFDQYDKEAPDGVTPVVRSIRETTFQGMPALYVRLSKAGPEHRDETEQIIAYQKARKGFAATFYILFLRSTPRDFVKDAALFTKVRQGFRVFEDSQSCMASNRP